jgi:kojibiose phosphorylase
MRRFWSVADVEIKGDADAQLAVRFATWSTRIAAPDDGGASSVGARNLNGDMYRGLVFWDVDIFQFPMMAAATPDLARNHLLNRVRFLPTARRRAQRDGYEGAAYPFTTAGLDYERKEEDFCFLEVHVNVAVAWAVLHYDTLVGDRDFFEQKGLQILVETCRYWATRVERDPAGLYHIRQVCGPDEFRRQGCDDNAYTNLMVSWVLRVTADRARGVAGRARRVLAIREDELERWARIAQGMVVPRDATRGLVEQSAGYFGLPEPDFRLNRGRWGMVDRTSKQADVLLLWQNRIPFAGDRDRGLMERCWHEYAPICHHLSSLSFCTHALSAIELRRRRDSEEFFRRTADVDLAHGNAQGTHGAGEGGLWMAVVQGFGGLRVRPGSGVEIDPILPLRWKRLRYRVVVSGQTCEVTVHPGRFVVRNLGGQRVPVKVGGRIRDLVPGAGVSARCDVWRPAQLEGVVFETEGVLDALVTRPVTRRSRVLRKLIEDLRASGIPCGVVSSGKSVPVFLRRAGLSGLVSAWADATCIEKLPPGPDLMEVACMRLRRLPWNCVAVVASTDSRKAAQAVGLRVCHASQAVSVAQLVRKVR